MIAGTLYCSSQFNRRSRPFRCKRVLITAFVLLQSEKDKVDRIVMLMKQNVHSLPTYHAHKWNAQMTGCSFSLALTVL